MGRKFTDSYRNKINKLRTQAMGSDVTSDDWMVAQYELFQKPRIRELHDGRFDVYISEFSSYGLYHPVISPILRTRYEAECWMEIWLVMNA